VVEKRGGDRHGFKKVRTDRWGRPIKMNGGADVRRSNPGPSGPVPARLFGEVGFDVVETLLDRVERIAGAGVLLDDEPFAAAGFGLGDDALEVERARADLAEVDVAGLVDLVVLEMDERLAALE